MGGRAVIGALAALCLCLAGLPPGHAVDVSFGTCPDKEVVQDFDVGRYAGHWYEIEAFWQLFELGGKCSQAEYTANGTGRVIVKNIMQDVRSRQEKSIEGFAELANPDASPVQAKLTVTFKIPVVGERKAPYWVLASDYDNYSLVYSCYSVLGFLRFESAWVLSRTATVADASTQQAIEAAIAKAALNRASFLRTTQDCGLLS